MASLNQVFLGRIEFPLTQPFHFLRQNCRSQLSSCARQNSAISKSAEIFTFVKMADVAKNKISCAILGCGKKGSSSDFVNFPKNEATKKIWKQLCGLANITSYSRLCKGHFRTSDFGPERLRKGVYPSQNLPVSFSVRNCKQNHSWS